MSAARAVRIAAPLAAAALFAALAALPAERPLPVDLCVLRRATGVPCLTCGVTRSLCAVARGAWGSAAQRHPVGPLLAASLAVGAVWTGADGVAGRRLAPRVRGGLGRAALAAGAALSVAYWIARAAAALF